MNSPVRWAADAATITVNFVSRVERQRHLIWNFVRRDLRSRYVGSMMGFFWSVIHPLVLLVCYSFVFSVIFQVRLRGPLPDNFPIFLFCGILPWLYFQDTVQRSATSVVENGNLIRKTLFPSEILPLTLALSNLVTHGVGLLILLAALLWLGTLSAAALLLPVYLLLLALLALGLGWLVAALQVFLRDSAQLLTVAMTLWFWFTPIFYQRELVPERFRPLMAYNPLVYVVEGYRRLLLEGRLPDWAEVAALAGFSLAVFALGGAVFRATKREFADVL